MSTMQPNCQLQILTFVNLLNAHLKVRILEQIRQTFRAVVSATVLFQQEIVLVESRTAFGTFRNDDLDCTWFFAFGAVFTATR